MFISKLLKHLLSPFMFYVGEEGGGGAESPLDDLTGLIGIEGEESPKEGGEEGGEEAPPEEAQPEPEDEPTFTLKVDGEERVVKQSELLANAQKYEAANKRFEEAANLRKQVETEKAAIPQERSQLKQALDHFTAQLVHIQQATQPNWEQLLNSDPAEYVRQRHAYEQRQAQLHQAQEAQRLLTQREQSERAQRDQARIVEEHTKLLDALPEWKDPEKQKTGAKAIVEYLKKSGFNDEELSGLNDHRHLIAARKAMLFDQLMQAQSAASKRVANVPPRVERPGSSAQVKPDEAKAKAARERFSKAPSIDTLADLL